MVRTSIVPYKHRICNLVRVPVQINTTQCSTHTVPVLVMHDTFKEEVYLWSFSKSNTNRHSCQYGCGCGQNGLNTSQKLTWNIVQPRDVDLYNSFLARVEMEPLWSSITVKHSAAIPFRSYRAAVWSSITVKHSAATEFVVLAGQVRLRLNWHASTVQGWEDWHVFLVGEAAALPNLLELPLEQDR